MKKFMKKITVLALALCVLVCTAACGKKVNNTNVLNNDINRTLQNGKITIGIVMEEPFAYEDENGENVGFSLDLAALFAIEILEMNVEFISIPKDQMFDSLKAGEVDCVWSRGVTESACAANDVDCSWGFLNDTQIVVVSEDKAENCKTTDDVKGFKYVVVEGSEGEKLAKELGFNYSTVSGTNEMLDKVNDGEFDAAIIKALDADFYINPTTLYNELRSTVLLGDNKIGVAFRKNSSLTDKMNVFIIENFEDIEERAANYGLSAAVTQPEF